VNDVIHPFFDELLYINTHFLDDFLAELQKTFYICTGIINH